MNWTYYHSRAQPTASFSHFYITSSGCSISAKATDGFNIELSNIHNTKPGLGACCPNLSIISLYNLILLQAIKLNVSVDENNLVQVKYNTPGHIWKQETVISKDVFGGKWW